MEKEKMVEIINKLLEEVEEEDVGISLLTTYLNDKEDLAFFSEESGEQISRILKTISDDSRRHKIILEELVDEFMAEVYKK